MAASGTRTIQIKLDGNASGLTRSAVEAYAALRKVGQDTSGLKKAQADADALASKLDNTAKTAREKGGLLGGALALGVSAAAPLVSAALVGGVAVGLVGVAALVQRNNKQVVHSFSDLGFQVSSEMKSVTNQTVPFLVKSGHSLQQTFANLGPQLRTAFRFAGPDITILTSGIERLATNAMPGLVNAARNSQPVMRGLSTVLGDVGTTVGNLFTDVSQHSDVLERDLGQFGALLKNVGGLIGSVLPGLASGFGTTVGTANTLLRVLKPIAPALGSIAGEALPAVGAFKLFGLATAPLNSLGSKVTSAGAKLGIYTAQLTQNSVVGTRVTATTSKIGSALGKVGDALPLVGVGFALLGDAMSAANDQQQAVLQGLISGGSAAQDATNKLAAAAPTIAHLAAGFKQGDASGRQFTDALNVATKGLDPLQKATAIYNADLDRFGPKAKQTVTAQKNLAAATDANQGAQQRLAFATQDANVALLNQTTALLNNVSAGLGFQSSILAVTQAQQNYASSLKSTGKNSLATKQASISYQQALVSEVTAAGAAAAAHNANATASQKAKATQQAETATILGLAAAAGKNAPPALKSMVAGLSNTQIAAFQATGKIAGTHQEIVKLPNGKSIKINVNSNGQAVAAATQKAIDKVHGRTVALTVNENIVLGKVPSAGVSGVAGLLGLGHRASGGPVRAGMPYIVGERRAEVFVPNQAGTVLPSVPSAVQGDTVTLTFAGEVIAQIIDGRLRSYNKEILRAVKAGSKIR